MIKAVRRDHPDVQEVWIEWAINNAGACALRRDGSLPSLRASREVWRDFEAL
jgi:hypothetical protein